MMTIDMQVSGGQIGRKLAYDEEELWFALVEIADNALMDLTENVADFATLSGGPKVVKLLRELADKIEERI